MGASMSFYTTSLANSLCGGSSRKLIAGWWYSILFVTLVVTLLSVLIMGTRSPSEGFAAVWSSLLLFGFSIGGTMIMRRFHNSMAVGFLMGCVVAMSQFFFLLFLIFVTYAKEQRAKRLPAREETMMSFCAIVQSVLLASFAAILFAHRSEILDKAAASTLSSDTLDDNETEMEQQQHSQQQQQQQQQQHSSQQQKGYRAPRPV